MNMTINARLPALLLALAAPLLLLGCVLTPGKFVSTMTINADRSFTFTYKGEVFNIDPSNMMKGLGDDKPGTSPDIEAKPALYQIAVKKKLQPAEIPDAEAEAKNREIAAALSKEVGYRSVTYQGKGKFLIDYAISGILTYGFSFPFNSDAEVVFPFVVAELRQGDTVRVKAPGFAKGSSSNAAAGGMSGAMDESAKLLDGTFTLDTDAEIVSQNEEDGVKESGKRHVITWRATPLTKDAPNAVLRFKR